jgi:tetratricopeptide (TPR) repeat protein
MPYSGTLTPAKQQQIERKFVAVGHTLTTQCMDISSTVQSARDLRKFRQVLFHLQMQCGSIHEIIQLLKKDRKIEEFENLKKQDPQLMTQLLAREMVLEARRSENSTYARKQLEKALQLDPLCPEACFDLAFLCQSPEAAMMWYQRCMDATRRMLGEDYFQEMLNEFKAKPWEQLAVVFYMKAKVCLAETLFRQGFYELSSLHFSEILAYDPVDKLNIRHYLMVSLLCENRFEEAKSLLNQYPRDISVNWYYCRAFLRFLEEGRSRRTIRALQRAFKRNLWTPVYLLGMEPLPSEGSVKKGNAFKEGSPLEAIESVHCIGPAFIKHSGLHSWIWEELKLLA